MFRKILISVAFVLCIIFISGATSSVANAGTIKQIAATGILKLGDDEKWEKTYNTAYGKIKVRFRKLFFASEEKKYHLIVWWDDKRIADGYCPKNTYGYEFKIFKDERSDRIFIDLETATRAVLMGYEPINKKLEKYADSKNYWSPDYGPTFLVDGDNDLQLHFEGNGNEYTTRYKLFWDESARWFGYKDVTKRRPAPPPAPTYYPSSTPSYTPAAPVYVEEEYDEIYYEGS